MVQVRELESMRLAVGIIMIGVVLLNGCGDSCSEYSEFSCTEIEEANYNVYFYFPGGSEKYIGEAASLSQCGAVARGFASSKQLDGNDKWSYICCMKAKGSSCYEKHR